MILQSWRKEMPKDISDEELSRKDMYFHECPMSSVHVNNLPVYRETFSNVSENFNALEELLSNFLEVHRLLTVNRVMLALRQRMFKDAVLKCYYN